MPDSGARVRSYGNFPKEKSHTANASWASTSWPACSDWQYSNTQFAYADDYDYTVMHDVVTPNFRKRIRSGELILNEMSSVRVRYKAANGHSVICDVRRPDSCWDKTYNATGSTNMSWRYLQFPELNPELPLLDTDVVSDEQLMINAVAGVDPTTFHVMEDVLQMRQFASSIAHPIEGMRDIARKFKASRTRAQALANAWAKYRFELLPLLGTAEALIRTSFGPLKRLEKGVRMRSSAVSSGNARWADKASSDDGAVDWNATLEQIVRKRAVVFYKLRSEHSGISQNLGTRFKDLPTGLWNTITLTFMIDRLINISSYITAMSNICDPSIQMEGGCITVEDYSKTELQVVRRRFPTGNELAITTPPVTTAVDSKIRTNFVPSAAMSPLNLDFRPQDLVKNTTRVLDLLAITITNLKL